MKSFFVVLLAFTSLNSYARSTALAPEFSNVRTASSAVTLDANDDEVLADASSAAFTVTLPSAASLPGKLYKVKKVASDTTNNRVTIVRAGSDTIDGDGNWNGTNANTEIHLYVANDNVEIISDGVSKWSIHSDHRIINAKYTTTTQTVTTSAAPIVATSSEFDTSGSYNTSTGQFTAPIKGTYHICGMFNGSGTATSSLVDNGVTINGRNATQSNSRRIGFFNYQVTSVSLTPSGWGCAPYQANAGDLLEVSIIRSSSVGSFSLGGSANWVSFERMAN